MSDNLDVRRLQILLDKQEIAETHYRYAACLDRLDLDGLKACFTDDAEAQYGNGQILVGPEMIVGWINNDIHVYARQHHLLTNYTSTVDGDKAQSLTYHTSHQVRRDDPDAVLVLVSRYHTDLRRTDDGWKMSRLVFEVVWAERRTDPSDRLGAFGGAGPAATGLTFGGWGPAQV